MGQKIEPHGIEVSVIQMTEEELEEYIRNGSKAPDGVADECECLYEYNPSLEWSSLNKNLCCTHCLWLYETHS